MSILGEGSPPAPPPLDETLFILCPNHSSISQLPYNNCTGHLDIRETAKAAQFFVADGVMHNQPTTNNNTGSKSLMQDP